MESILYTLFSGNYDNTLEIDKAQLVLLREAQEEWQKIQQAFGKEFVDHLNGLETDREDLRCFQWYRSGFILGVRLMLEALEH